MISFLISGFKKRVRFFLNLIKRSLESTFRQRHCTLYAVIQWESMSKGRRYELNVASYSSVQVLRRLITCYSGKSTFAAAAITRPPRLIVGQEITETKLPAGQQSPGFQRTLHNRPDWPSVAVGSRLPRKTVWSESRTPGPYSHGTQRAHVDTRTATDRFRFRACATDRQFAFKS